MRTKSLRRKAASIVKGRWAAYATAGAASAFTCANSAEASIHYSGIIGAFFGWDRTKSARFQLDQPGDSFGLRHFVDFSFTGTAKFGIFGQASAGFAGFYCPSNPQVASVSKLSRGELISSRPFLAREAGQLAQSAFNDCAGQFDYRDVGFIGFKFNNGSGDQYGWVRLKFSGPNNAFRLIDYAYADPGEPIRAGQTASDDMVPEEGSLGGLALGAAGLMAWRKRRSRAVR